MQFEPFKPFKPLNSLNRYFLTLDTSNLVACPTRPRQLARQAFWRECVSPARAGSDGGWQTDSSGRARSFRRAAMPRYVLPLFS